MRRDRIMECTIATVAGIGLAAVLIASLGVRSSGPATPLRAEVSAAAEKPVIAASEVPRQQAVRKRPARVHHRRRARAQAPPAPAPAPAPVVAQAPPVSRPSPAPPRPVRIQPVSAPAPAPRPAPKPAPVKAPSRPKPSGGKGISFDDSG
jgi:outer membrane biosynthesis protein TonB